jgi:hypothetical protein
MRRALCVLLLGCTGPVPVARLTLTPLPTATAVEEPAFEDCRVEGSGDRRRYTEEEDVPFDVFTGRRAHEVVLVIAVPSEVHVTWSQLPLLATADGRARVEIGGQQHVRYAGYAGLKGRTFSLKQRFAAEPGHLWARRGAPVEVVAFEHGVLTARVETPFAQPKTLAVRGSCGGIAYVPTEPEQPEEKAVPVQGTAGASGSAVDLHAAPSGKPFVTLTLDPDSGIGFDIIERAGRFSRVRATVGDVEIDAWVPKTQLDENAALGLHGFGTGGSSSCGGAMDRGTITRDTPLFVGAKPRPLDGAVIEKDAEIYLDVSSEETVQGHVYVPFTFTDDLIQAPDASRLWVIKDAIH